MSVVEDSSQIESVRDSVFDIYQKMGDDGVLSAYHGTFDQSVVEMLLKQAKSDMEKRRVDKRALKKTYSILVECLENILKHTYAKKSDGIVALSIGAERVSITVGNLIKDDEKEMLQQKIDTVNSMDKAALKKLHFNKLIDGEISDKGGAGLGIIEIAMKSQNKIEYFFRNYGENLVFFSLQTSISN